MGKKLSGQGSFWKGILILGLFLLEWQKQGGGRGPAPRCLPDFVFLLIICSASVIDAKTGLIPNEYTGAAFMVSAAGIFVDLRTGLAGMGRETPGLATEVCSLLSDHFLGMLCLSLPLLLLAIVLPGSIGGGDIKLVAAGGLYMGVRLVICAFLMAACMAGFCSLFLLLLGKVKTRDRIPLGPFLGAGMLITLLLGT